MKVLILLQGRFPTEKAYGVTTIGTIKSLLRLGNQVTIFSLASNRNELAIEDENFTLEYYSETNFSRRAKLLSFSGMGFINKISWFVFWRLTSLRNRAAILEAEADVFWIRDFAMLSFVPKRKPIVFELHGHINRFKIFKLRFKIRDQIAILAPISRGIEKQLGSLSSNRDIVRAPMGIENEYLESNKGLQEYLERIEALRRNCFKGLKISYFGKFSPNGYSKGIEDLLELAKLNLKEQKNYDIYITGGAETEVIAAIDKLSKYGLTENDVQMPGHHSHYEIISKMKESDVLVLPMPASKKYMGFPLKAIESIASGRIVVAARCRVYQDIFDESFEPYWYEPNDAMSLNLAIIMALNDELLGERLAKGLEFSSRFTWDSRTKKLLDGLISSRDKFNS